MQLGEVTLQRSGIFTDTHKQARDGTVDDRQAHGDDANTNEQAQEELQVDQRRVGRERQRQQKRRHAREHGTGQNAQAQHIANQRIVHDGIDTVVADQGPRAAGGLQVWLAVDCHLCEGKLVEKTNQRLEHGEHAAQAAFQDNHQNLSGARATAKKSMVSVNGLLVGIVAAD
jgi:hypothetical protein